MADFARVDSIDVIRAFRVALIKFQETVNVALADAESELTRALVWLEGEQSTHWQHQVRTRSEIVAGWKDKVRQKKLFKDSSGKTPSAIDEEKQLNIAQRRLVEAQEKLDATRKWSRKLQKEIHNYKGGVQRLGTAAMVDVPNAIAKLEKLAGKLDQYTAAGPVMASPLEETSSAGTTPLDGAASMSRIDSSPDRPETEDLASRPDFPKVAEPQVILARVTVSDSEDVDVPKETDFVVCPSPGEARQQANARSVADPGSRYAIFDPAGRLIMLLDAPAAQAAP